MSFFCGISGEPPQDAVVSTKSGHIYERRLITKYITDNGTDPITGEKLEESDLVSVKASESLSRLCYVCIGFSFASVAHFIASSYS